MKRLYRLVIATLLLSTLLGASVLRVAAQDSQPIVHAVLFYSPSCPHCQYVINEVLPPLSHKDGPQLQMIGLSSNAMSGDAKKAKAAGCNDYLAKPIDEDLLLSTLRQFLG